MVGGGSGFLRRLLGTHPVVKQPASGGMNMDWTVVMSLVVVTALAIYLIAALLKPEIFS